MSVKLFIECKICNCNFTSNRSLGIHIKRTHHIKTKEYYDKFLKKSDEGFCKTCNSPTRFLNLAHGYLNFCCIKCVNNCKDVRNKIETTNLTRYGVKTSTQNKGVLEKRRKNNIEKYGIEHPFSLKEIKEKQRLTMLKLYGVENPSQLEFVQKKKEKTYLEHYGTTTYLITDECRKKLETKMQNYYGVKNPSQADEIKQKKEQTLLKNYGVTNPNYSTEIQSYKNKRYYYNNTKFDSSWELAYYIWLTDNNIIFEYQPNISFDYYVNDKMHKYFPDFLINDKIYEIKGDQFFNENNELIDPYNNKVLIEKFECMMQNNVIILRETDLSPILKYINEKYGKNYVKQFKRK